MKCIAVVMMAFVACVSAGGIPLIYNAGYGIPAISRYSSIPASTLIASNSYHLPSLSTYSTLNRPLIYSNILPAAPRIISAPRIIAAPRIYAAPIAPITTYTHIPGQAKYTAINRGALHQAPLPGHGLSQTAINLQPAPGTL